MSDLDDIRSDLKSERIQLKSERIQKKLEILVGWNLEGGATETGKESEAGEDGDVAENHAAALCKTYTLTSPRAAMAFARYADAAAEGAFRFMPQRNARCTGEPACSPSGASTS